MIQGSHNGWHGGRWHWDPIGVNRASRDPWEACVGKVDMVAARTVFRPQSPVAGIVVLQESLGSVSPLLVTD